VAVCNLIGSDGGFLDKMMIIACLIQVRGNTSWNIIENLRASMYSDFPNKNLGWL